MRNVKIPLGLSLCVLATFPPLSGGSAPGPASKRAKPPQAEVHTIILGPFLLGDAYDKMPDLTLTLLEQQPSKHWKDFFAKVRGPKHADVVKALNGCKFYVIDKTETTRVGKRRVRDFSGEYAHVVAAGNFSFELKDQTGKPIRIHLKKAQLNKRIIIHGAEPCYTRSSLTIDLDFERPDADKHHRHQQLKFVSLDLYWDLNGKAYWVDPLSD